VPEIEGGQIKEVDDQDDLSPDEMSSNEEHDEGKLQEVVDDEVASNTRSSLNIVTVLREEVPQINDLEEEEENPVERGNDSIQSKWCSECCIVSPNGISPLLPIIRGNTKGVVDADKDGKQPCDDGQDLVRPNGLNIMGLPSCKRVCV